MPAPKNTRSKPSPAPTKPARPRPGSAAQAPEPDLAPDPRPAKPAQLAKITEYADQLLRIPEFKDFPGARNGLQVGNDGRVTRIAASVDSHALALRGAVEAGADLLVVHHGLFWDDPAPVTGRSYRRLKTLLDANLALYSAHLPLDAHPTLGNNALLMAAIGARETEPFFEEHGQLIGRAADVDITRDALAAKLAEILGHPPRVIAGGPARVRRIGVVSGGAGTGVARAAAAGCDTFVTGEGAHWTYGAAHELGVNLIYGGHYATEVFGVRMLAAHLSQKFALPMVFIDTPSGL